MAIIIDPIADMFVRIKNAIARKYHEVNVPYSQKKVKILEIFKREGYISEIEQFNNHKGINQHQSAISGIKRVSKPGLKVYSSSENLPRVLSGYGTAIISTSKGLLTDKEARKANVGGEVVAFV